MNNTYEKIVYSKKNKNFIAVVAIGSQLEKAWKKFACPNLKKYCLKNNINLILIYGRLISKKSKYFKSLAWQRFLVGDLLISEMFGIENVCLLDCDILVNPFSPNIFKNYDEDKIGLVSMHKNLPFDSKENRKKISFFRKFYYDKKYPLDSMIHASISQKYKSVNLPVQKDYACIGVLLFNIKNHSSLFKKWFYKYTDNFLLGEGMQTHINYEILKYGKVQWLNYKFQALWVNEMAWKYPFLYKYKNKKNKFAHECMEQCLFDNYFLHFAGGWYEYDMWKYYQTFKEKKWSKFYDDYQKYKNKKIVIKNYGRILSKNTINRLLQK